MSDLLQRNENRNININIGTCITYININIFIIEYFLAKNRHKNLSTE